MNTRTLPAVAVAWACAPGADTALPDSCATAPTVTWASFGDAFLTQSCQPCHASTAPDRYGAPEEVVFDTVDDAWAWADRVVARSAAEPATMPPGGGLDPDDVQRLVWWFTCAEPGT